MADVEQNNVTIQPKNNNKIKALEQELNFWHLATNSQHVFSEPALRCPALGEFRFQQSQSVLFSPASVVDTAQDPLRGKSATVVKLPREN